MYAEKDMAGKRNPQLKPQEEWVIVDGGIPAIISQELFDKVQAMLIRNHNTGGRHKAREIYLLSGLLFCGECGAGVYGNSRHSGRRDPDRNGLKYTSYRCSNAKCINKEIRREAIEEFVLEELYERLFSDKSIKKLSSMLNEYNLKKSAQNNDDLVYAQTDLVEVTQEISRVIRLVAKDGIGIDTAKVELKRLEERKNGLESFIEELTLKNTAMINEDMIFDLICKSKDFIREKNISECRGFIETYVEKVLLYSDKVEVLFKINIPAADGDTLIPLKSEAQKDIIQQSYKA
jgi:site-specific DNA recombinase